LFQEFRMFRVGRRLAALAALIFFASCADEAPFQPEEGSGPSSPATLTDAGPASLTVPTVVMSGLDSPRGLAFGPEGALYVAEAGTPAVTGPCVQVPRGPSQNCFSGTGAISRLWKGKQERVASGLPSLYNTMFGDITGPHDIGFQGRGNMFVTIGFGGPPAARAGLGSFAAGVGYLVRVLPNGKWKTVADISGFEGANNPDGGFTDSNPYGVLVEPGQRYATDAGGNDLLRIRANGDISLVAVFSPTPAPPPFNSSEAVPTEVTRGPDGALYVSTLTGVPFLPGVAAIYRIGNGETPEVYAGGFKAITDHAWGADGSLYVLEYDTAPFIVGAPGRLTRVFPGGSREVISETLTNPTGVVVGPDGAVYVSNRGNVASVGEVLRFAP
jgi:hypothetical protein